MFKLRGARLSDLNDLYELSLKVFFINLPRNREEIERKIQSSIKSFQTPSKDLYQNHYIFVLEDQSSQRVIGCSMIHAKHGTEAEPHFYLSVGHEQKYSQTLNTGFSHGTLKLGVDTNGPTEIGGLVLHPDYRKNGRKLGKALSFIRFVYMGLHPDNFEEQIHSELLPPFDDEGNSPLWEAIGRRFLNLDYHEADILSRSNKEFILSLFPSDNIYMTLLPLEARDSIGRVGRDTKPVERMLQRIGFKYTNEVDPFDGGPHYRAKLNEIEPVKQTKEITIDKNLKLDGINLFSLKQSEEFETYLLDEQLLKQLDGKNGYLLKL